MMRRLLAITLVLGLFGSILFARPGVVRLTDGQSIEGDIIREEADSVTVAIRGIETSVPRDRIDTITYTTDRAGQFEERRKALKDDDVDGHIALARWAFDNRLYHEAENLLSHVLAEVDPNSREAQNLLNLVRRQIALERSRDNPPPSDEPIDEPDEAADDPKHPMLTPAQIQRIKRLELRENDSGVRVRISNETRGHITEAARINSRQFTNLPPARQLAAVREYGTPEMLEQVEITGDPATLATYRQRIQPIVMAGCAGAGCHAAPGQGDFALFPRADASEPASYTNFLILQEYTKTIETGTGGGGIFDSGKTEVRMINRNRPDQSLLIQYMLPRDLAAIPHPETRGYDGVARGVNDQRLRQIQAWIRTLGPFQSNYGIDYTPPGQTPATQPAE